MRIESRQANISYQDYRIGMRIESRQANILYQDYRMLLLTRARPVGCVLHRDTKGDGAPPPHRPPAAARAVVAAQRVFRGGGQRGGAEGRHRGADADAWHVLKKLGGGIVLISIQNKSNTICFEI